MMMILLLFFPSAVLALVKVSNGGEVLHSTFSRICDIYAHTRAKNKKKKYKRVRVRLGAHHRK